MSEMGSTKSYKDSNEVYPANDVDEEGDMVGKETADAIDKEILDSHSPEEVDDAKGFLKTIPDFADTVKEEESVEMELPITHLINPENKRVFEATPDLMKRKDLVPCDEDGKKVLDHRIF